MIQQDITGYLLKEHKNTNSKGYMHPNVYTSIIYNSHTMEAAQVSTDWWMDKEDVIYTVEYDSSIKKEWNLAICNNLDEARILY